jgi:hypothetical protein
MNGKNQFDTIYTLFGRDASKPYMGNEEKEIIIESQSNCIHSKYESKNQKLSLVEQNTIKQLKNMSHVNTISEFNKKFQEYIGDITSDIFSRILTLFRQKRIKQRQMKY